jgi:hypothetical protein
MPTKEELFAQLKASGNTKQALPIRSISEAMLNYKTPIRSPEDALYVFACYNLLNAYVKTDHATQHMKGNRHEFKTFVSKTVAEVIEKKFEDVTIWMDDSFTFVRLFGIDFSFHDLPANTALRKYRSSARNIQHVWSQFRLQPRAPLVLDWARQVRAESLSAHASDDSHIQRVIFSRVVPQVSAPRKKGGAPKRKKREKTKVQKSKKEPRASKAGPETVSEAGEPEKAETIHTVKFWSNTKMSTGTRPLQGGLPGLGKRH